MHGRRTGGAAPRTWACAAPGRREGPAWGACRAAASAASRQPAAAARRGPRRRRRRRPLRPRSRSPRSRASRPGALRRWSRRRRAGRSRRRRSPRTITAAPTAKRRLTAPTRRAAAARRGAGPPARGRPRSARGRGAGPRPSGRARRPWSHRRGSRRSWHASRRSGPLRRRGRGSPPPRAAARLSSLCPRRPRGFLKVEPKVLIPEGCASRRRSRIPARVSRTVGRVGRLEGEGDPRDDLARAEVRAAVGEAELVGRRRSRAAGGADVDPLEDLGQLAAVGVGVHPHRAAGGAGDVDSELEPGKTPARRLGRRRRQPGAAAADDSPLAIALDRGQLAVELEREATEAIVGDEQVRA